MPHTRRPPETPAEILATANRDPAWTAILEEFPIPQGSEWGDDASMLKELSEGMYPRLRATLDASRPESVTERDVYIDIPPTELKSEAGQIRVLVCQSATPSKTTSSPIILLFHGGGHTVGNPESELPLARLLTQQFHAVVVMPAYRLAPEHKFPSSFNDALETLKIVASDIVILKQQTETSTSAPTQSQPQPRILAATTIPSTSLTIGGTSAGATIATSINHLYHRFRTSRSTSPSPSPSPSPSLPPITSLFLSCGSCVNASSLHDTYKPFFLSRQQNASEPPVDKDMYDLFFNAVQMDHSSPIWSSFDQYPELFGTRNRVGDDHVWMVGSRSRTSDDPSTTSAENINQPPMRVYFQICGCDMSRDDGLIYERVLREECGVETRVDIYEGFGHVFWGMGGKYPEMEMSVMRERDSVDGVGWLIGVDRG